MKVIVRSAEDNRRIWIPNLLINAKILRFILREAKVNIDEKLYQVLPKLCNEIKRFRRHHKRFVLVDVITSEKEHIKIIL